MSNGNNNGHHGNGLVHVNGHKSDAAIVGEHDPASSAGLALLWDGLPPAVTQTLGQPLDPSLVSQRKGRGGKTFDYLEGHAVIDQANRIFGYGGWGYELVAGVTLRQIETVDPQTGEIKTVSVYSAPVRVTVAGALPRTDTGFHAVTDETPDGHDTASKGAVTDGMKRAFRSFGVQFGNGFYGDQPQASVPAKPERVPAQANRPVRQAQNLPSTGSGGERNESQVERLRGRLIELAVKQGFDEAKVRAAVQRQMDKELDDLTADELGKLVESAANKLNQMRQAQAA